MNDVSNNKNIYLLICVDGILRKACLRFEEILVPPVPTYWENCLRLASSVLLRGTVTLRYGHLFSLRRIFREQAIDNLQTIVLTS